ncbi:MAG: TlpA family protein disulfide reductase [Chloroflexi bacterium]|nr:TlpA family protein disulfide reductase [Chloroflexota bacterium]
MASTLAAAATAPARAQTEALTGLTRLALLAAVVLALLGTYGERWGLNGAGPGGAAGVARVGEPAPSFSAQTLAGTQVSLEDFRGRVVVLNFWATWCGPCRVEMPEFERYQAEMGDRVAILGANMQESPSVIAPFVRQYGITFPILLDESGVLAAPYRVTGLPTSVVLDRSGIIRERVVGPMTRDVLARRVERLL